MKTMLRVSLLAVTALALSSCAPPANTSTNVNTNANTNANVAAKSAPPTADALLAMETKAWEAWKNKDAKYIESIMSENMVMLEKGKRLNRAESVKMVAEHPCEVKTFSLAEPKVTTVSGDVIVVTYKGTADITCVGEKMPPNVTAATVWVRSGDSWKAAYHGEVPIKEAPASGTAPANKNEEAGVEKKAVPPPPKNDTTAATSNTNSNSNSAPSQSSDALTDALMAVEKKGWEAWMKQDAATMQAVTTKDLSFVDVTGKATHGQAEVIKGWTDGSCKVSSVSVSDGKATMIADNVAILTYKGTAIGTCGPMKLEPLWGTTVAIKDGDSWKAAYIFEMPVV